MKKLLAVILALATVLAFAACGKNGGETSGTEKSSENGSSETPTNATENENADAVSAEPNTKTISIGDTITTSEYEFTLKTVEFTYELMPKNVSSVYSSYPAESGKVYIHVGADVKNIMQRDMRIDELYTANALYDGQYKYSGFVVVDDDNRFDWVGSYVAATPLETCGAHALIECPAEVDTSNKSVKVTLKLGETEYEYVLR